MGPQRSRLRILYRKHHHDGSRAKIYMRTAVQSAIVGVAIAFVVLLLATRVFHIALFASFSIVSTLVSVVGMMVMLGWQLGSTESILIAVIAGFSVDYVVHL